MNIHCLCIVKNEADIIGEVLTEAAKWANNIFVADNGSDDQTVEIIQAHAARFEHIHFLGVFDMPFTDEIRGHIFNAIPDNPSVEGDWWCRLDADEFYIDNPRIFLANLGKDIDCVHGASYQFYFTDKEYAELKSNETGFYAKPLSDRFRYYLNNWSEMRFAKHTHYFDWPDNAAWPLHMINPATKRIRLRTYQHRSQTQIENRLRIRLAILKQTQGRVFPHILNTQQSEALQIKIGFKQDAAQHNVDFRQVIKDHKTLDSYSGDGYYIAREENLPGFRRKPAFAPVGMMVAVNKVGFNLKHTLKKLR
jgi:glycosyltransferase involved in cell wall biosynthesis